MNKRVFRYGLERPRGFVGSGVFYAVKMENKWLVTNHNFEFSCPAWDFDCRVKFIWTQ